MSHGDNSRVLRAMIAGIFITVMATATTAAHGAQPLGATLEVLAAGLIGTFSGVAIFWRATR
jgi:hypothetical protein